MQVVTIATPQLGDRSYLVHDGDVALVVDPQRDIDRIEAAAQEAGVRITHVVETHIHNDYLTGGLALARRTGATYLLSGADEVAFDRTPLADGDEFGVGRMTVRALATPGHTYHHLSYAVRDGDEQAVFTGGSLLYGSVGRTDLVGPGDTEVLTRAQYSSVRALAEQLPDDTLVYPTHGFGSFCASGPSMSVDYSTIGEQKRHNHVFTDPDEDHFVQTLLAGLGAYPAYYTHMSPMNREGADGPQLTMPAPLDPADLRRRIHSGQWVVDLRNRVAFASGHLQGTVSFEYGDGTNFTTFLGWTLPWGEPVTLVGTHADVEAAIRDLSRIGIDGPDVALGDDPGQILPGHPVQSYPRVGWDALVERILAGDPPTVLDVRRDEEYAADHVTDAVHIPLHELLKRMGELDPALDPLWVHCGSGYRAGVAASLLQRAGHQVVHLDGAWSDAAAAGVPVSR